MMENVVGLVRGNPLQEKLLKMVYGNINQELAILRARLDD